MQVLVDVSVGGRNSAEKSRVLNKTSVPLTYLLKDDGPPRQSSHVVSGSWLMRALVEKHVLTSLRQTVQCPQQTQG